MEQTGFFSSGGGQAVTVGRGPERPPAGKRVDRSIADEATVLRYLKLLGLREDGTLDMRVARLEFFFDDIFAVRENPDGTPHALNFDPQQLKLYVVCDCNGEFDDRLLCCPFCGSTEESPNISKAQRSVVGFRQVDAIRDLKARYVKIRDAFGVRSPIEQLPAAPPAPPAPPSAPSSPAPTSSSSAPPAAPETPKLVKVKPKKKGKVDEKPSEPPAGPTEVEVVPPDAIVPVKGEAPPFALPPEQVIEVVAVVDGSEAELDQRKSEAEALFAEIVTGSCKVAVDTYKLGRVLAEIDTRKLYLQRRDARGAPKYKSFSQFLNSEFDFGSSYAFDLITQSEKFNAEQVRTLGPAKLKYLARCVHTEAGRLLLKEAQEKGLSVGEVRERVNEIAPPVPRAPKSDPGTLPPGPSAEPDVSGSSEGDASPEPETKKGPKATPKPAAARVTTTLVPGRQVLQLLARPKKRGAVPQEAKSLGDDPWCEIDLPNGVKQVFRVMNVKGKLKLLIETVRLD